MLEIFSFKNRLFLLRVLGIDIGEKRCGVAISDMSATIASPVGIFPLTDVVNYAGGFLDALSENEADLDLIVFGLPKSMSGQEGKQARRIRAVADQISKAIGIDYEFIDERLTSISATEAMRNMGYDSKSMRGKLDAIAATIFLQTWLDAKRKD